MCLSVTRSGKKKKTGFGFFICSDFALCFLYKMKKGRKSTNVMVWVKMVRFHVVVFVFLQRFNASYW